MESNVSLIIGQPNEPDRPVIHTLLTNEIKIVVLDYHDLYLVGFVTFLGLVGFNVTGKARKGTELLKLLATNELPDIVIINYKTTKPKTLIVVKLVKRKYPFLKVVINTQYTSKLLLNNLELIGVDGVILKTVFDKEKIIDVLNTVYRGHKSFWVL